MALIDINWKPDQKILRNFGFIAAAVFGALGVWAKFKHSIVFIHLAESTAGAAAWALWALTAACLVLALAFPRGLKYLFLGLTLIGLPIGYVVSHVLMAAIFYLVLTPIGLILRAMGRDSLQRKFDPEAKSYWIPKQPVRDVRRYYRQF
jgi:hypothetical protein